MEIGQYDGLGGRPAAHLVIAWPHGVPVVDAMVEAFHAGRANMTVKGQPVECCDMTVASLVNAEMRNASELLACIYATETAGPKAEWRIKQKSVCPSLPLPLYVKCRHSSGAVWPHDRGLCALSAALPCAHE